MKKISILIVFLLVVVLCGCETVELTANTAPTATIAPLPTSTPLPLPTTTSIPPTPPTHWSEGWNIEYLDKGEWSGEFTCIGPAVCEWWDQKGDGYEHEGFVILQVGEYVKFTQEMDLIGHSWSIAPENVDRLIISYRHLVFYANTLTKEELIEALGEENYTKWFYVDPPLKLQHSYMLEYNCNFVTQDECTELDALVRHLPEGVIIEQFLG